MHRKGKPARKCHGCILNLGDHCAIYPEPHDKWHHSRCSSHNDRGLYNEYLEYTSKHPENNAKKVRRNTARTHNTMEHHHGMKIKKFGR